LPLSFVSRTGGLDEVNFGQTGQTWDIPDLDILGLRGLPSNL
jgi:hypothetical protein